MRQSALCFGARLDLRAQQAQFAAPLTALSADAMPIATRVYRAFALLLTVALICALPARAADSGDATLLNLIALSAQRLALADTVAHVKWTQGKPVTDPAREHALLTDVGRRAPSYGIAAASAQSFFKDQIEANKDVQNTLIAAWQVTPPPSTPLPDLATVVRPQLDQITTQLLIALSRSEALRKSDDCPSRLAASLADWRTLHDSDSLHNHALTRAMAHVCVSGGVGAVA